jgi:hypothetical protein
MSKGILTQAIAALAILTACSGTHDLSTGVAPDAGPDAHSLADAAIDAAIDCQQYQTRAECEAHGCHVWTDEIGNESCESTPPADAPAEPRCLDMLYEQKWIAASCDQEPTGLCGGSGVATSDCAWCCEIGADGKPLDGGG